MPVEAKRFHIVTVGCQMNLYDSEVLAGKLLAEGYVRAPSPQEADLVLINTCSVRDRAERKARSMTAEFAALRRRNPGLLIGVVGCMAQRLGPGLTRNGAVNLVVGTDCYDDFIDILKRARASGGPVVETSSRAGTTYSWHPRACTSVKAFISIMRGCDNFCSYCIVPYVRGRERSKPHRAILDEVRHLVDLGVKEVTLLGQNVNSYRDGALDFAGLLGLVDAVDGLERIRFTTSHPKDLTDDLIRAMRDLPKVCEHLHLPMQSGSDRVLGLMNRGYTAAEYRARHALARSLVPGLAVTTDLLVGFPSETGADFEDTIAAVRGLRFEAAFMFRYSEREGTRAAALKDDVPEETKLERLRRLIALQNEVTDSVKRDLPGRRVEVLVEGPSPREPGFMLGRTRENWLAKIPSKGVREGSKVNTQVTSVTRWMLTCAPAHGKTEA